MRRMKTRASRSRPVASSSSSSEDDISLSVSQEEAPTPPALSTDACLRSGINLPTSTRHNGRTTFKCKFLRF